MECGTIPRTLPGKSRSLSLCWYCLNAAPGPEAGCAWSERYVPVPGWIAERRDQRPHSKNGPTGESYRVHACPAFLRLRKDMEL